MASGTHCLAQPHLISQDTIEAILVEGDHPAHAAQLVVTHLTHNPGQHSLPTTSILISQQKISTCMGFNVSKRCTPPLTLCSVEQHKGWLYMQAGINCTVDSSCMQL